MQIRPVNGRADENGIGFPLDADFILARGIDQPSLFLREDFFEQRSDVDTGTDEPKIFHGAQSSSTLYLRAKSAPQELCQTIPAR
jgi:hypothetical protein